MVSRQPSFLIAVDPADPDVVYARGEEGTERSADGGATWTNIGQDLQDEEGDDGIFQLVVDPGPAGKVYADASFGRLVTSSDRGATWQVAWYGPEDPGDPLYYSYLLTLTAAPQGGAVYAAYLTSHGEEVYRSTDGGTSWALAVPAPPARTADAAFGNLAIDAGSSGKLYLATSSYGVLTGVPGGSFAAANAGIEDLSFLAVAADPHVPGRLFALAIGDPGAPAGSSRRFLLRSSDGGASWSPPSGAGRAAYVNGLAADSAHPGTWYLATAGAVLNGILKTSDGGDTWEAVNRGLRRQELARAVAVGPRPGRTSSMPWAGAPRRISSAMPTSTARGPSSSARPTAGRSGGGAGFRSRRPAPPRACSRWRPTAPPSTPSVPGSGRARTAG